MSDNKIIFAGPSATDITTAVKAISDIEPVTKEENTVAMDYGILKLDTGDQIYIYGAPEREKLKHVQETLNKDCIGLVLFIDNTDNNPVETLLQYMEDYQSLVDKKGVAVGLTRYDDAPTPNINDYHVTLREKKINIPIFSVFSKSGQEKKDIVMIIRALLYNLDSGVD